MVDSTLDLKELFANYNFNSNISEHFTVFGNNDTGEVTQMRSDESRRGRSKRGSESGPN